MSNTYTIEYKEDNDVLTGSVTCHTGVSSFSKNVSATSAEVNGLDDNGIKTFLYNQAQSEIDQWLNTSKGAGIAGNFTPA